MPAQITIAVPYRIHYRGCVLCSDQAPLSSDPIRKVLFAMKPGKKIREVTKDKCNSTGFSLFS